VRARGSQRVGAKPSLNTAEVRIVVYDGRRPGNSRGFSQALQSDLQPYDRQPAAADKEVQED
jgi:hypothetical protein